MRRSWDGEKGFNTLSGGLEALSSKFPLWSPEDEDGLLPAMDLYLSRASCIMPLIITIVS